MADVVKACGLKVSDLRARAVRGAGPLGPVVGSTIGVLWESAGASRWCPTSGKPHRERPRRRGCLHPARAMSLPSRPVE
jgi:hypothetical protein